MNEATHAQFLEWRDIEDPCPTCGGSGRRVYVNTATWRGGMGGSKTTPDVCDECWGTGDARRHGADLRATGREMDARIQEQALTLLARSAGANLSVCWPAIAALNAELQRLALGRKERAPYFANICMCLASILTEAVERAKCERTTP